MRALPSWFMATGAVLALVGMGWGIQMSASHDHTLSPAHGHLNLIGFVSMSIFGIYYALSPAAAASRLGAVHYGLTLLAVLVLVPGIALAISAEVAVAAQVGSLLAIAAFALFAVIVLRHGVGRV